MSGAIPPLPQYAFTARCLVKHRDFTLPYLLFSTSWFIILWAKNDFLNLVKHNAKISLLYPRCSPLLRVELVRLLYEWDVCFRNVSLRIICLKFVTVIENKPPTPSCGSSSWVFLTSPLAFMLSWKITGRRQLFFFFKLTQSGNDLTLWLDHPLGLDVQPDTNSVVSWSEIWDI
jgi:hypothetical protein